MSIVSATLKNTNTGQSITMRPAGSSFDTLTIRINDTVELSITVQNTTGTSATYKIVWTTGEGDVTSDSVFLLPNITMNFLLSHKYTDTGLAGKTITTAAYADAGSKGIDGIVYAYISVSQLNAEFRIDD